MELGPVLNDIINWSLRIIGISIGLSILSIFITVDLSQSSNQFIDIFVLSLSNFSFFIGMLVICAGLLIIFLKKPEGSSFSKERKSKFKPKYKKERMKTSRQVEETSSSNTALFSKREYKMIFSGTVAVLFAVVLWLGYSVIKMI